MSIVSFAEAELTREEYDRAYCVLDRDSHANYDAAIQRLRGSQHERSGRLCIAVSVPCFEVWLLLHFRYSASPFIASGRRSACDKVLRELENHLPGYRKGQNGVFNALASKLDKAIANATRLETQNEESSAGNPATGMHHLINHLRCLKTP